MKLHIENFAKISSADIRFDGLTVIAGDNNTGKSTVGKILYSLYRGQSNIDRRIADERIKAVREAFAKVARTVCTDAECQDVLEGRLSVRDLLIAKFKSELASEDAPALVGHPEQMAEDFANNFEPSVRSQVETARSLPNQQVARIILRRVFNCVFHGQYHPLSASEGNATIRLTVRDQENSIVFHADGEETAFPTSLFARSFFINSPDALGYLNLRDLEHNPKYARLLDKYTYELAVDLVREKKTSVIGEAGLEAKIRPILEQLNDVIRGDFTTDESGNLVFHERGNEKPTLVENLSQGMRSLLLLRRMLQKGILSDSDVLVLDEPEIHLHPAWQLVYARAIAILRRELNLTILVTTHSPYFLKALQVYSEMEKISGATLFYLSRCDPSNGMCTFDECTKNLNDAFKSLYEPFARLM